MGERWSNDDGCGGCGWGRRRGAGWRGDGGALPSSSSLSNQGEAMPKKKKSPVGELLPG